MLSLHPGLRSFALRSAKSSLHHKIKTVESFKPKLEATSPRGRVIGFFSFFFVYSGPAGNTLLIICTLAQFVTPSISNFPIRATGVGRNITYEPAEQGVGSSVRPSSPHRPPPADRGCAIIRPRPDKQIYNGRLDGRNGLAAQEETSSAIVEDGRAAGCLRLGVDALVPRPRLAFASQFRG